MDLRLLAKQQCCDGEECPAVYVDDSSGEIVVQGLRLPDSLVPSKPDEEGLVGGLTADLLREAAAAL